MNVHSFIGNLVVIIITCFACYRLGIVNPKKSKQSPLDTFVIDFSIITLLCLVIAAAQTAIIKESLVKIFPSLFTKEEDILSPLNIGVWMVFSIVNNVLAFKGYLKRI